jgi:hypothetical protein
VQNIIEHRGFHAITWRTIVGLIRNSSRPLRRLLVAGLLVLILCPAGATNGTELGPVVVNNGSGRMSGANHILDFTIGEPGIATFSAVTRQMGVGFWYIVATGGSSGVSDVPTPKVTETQLFQNAPNPFNPSTTIKFAVSQAGPVLLRLFDLQGRQIAVLADAEMGTGEHSLVFQPRGLASGVYLYQLQTVDRTLTRRLLLVK